MKKYFILPLLFCMYTSIGHSQVGFGITTGIDFYQMYDKGDPDDLLKSSTSGSAIVNLILGPKMWIGGPKFSLSLEAPFNWGPLHFDLNEWKGIGAIAFPLGAKLNFGAPSGFSNSNLFGFSIGGGIQYMNTENFGTKKEFRDKIDTGYFSTYYGEAALAIGLAGFDVSLYVRYGQGEKETRNLNIGLVTNINFSHLGQVLKGKSKDGEDNEVMGEEEVSFLD